MPRLWNYLFCLTILLSLAALAAPAAADMLAEKQWELKQARTELSLRRRDFPGGLELFSPTAQTHGWVETAAGPVTAGRTYRLQVAYRVQNVPNPIRSVSSRLTWLDRSGKQVRPPDYLLEQPAQDGLRRMELISQAPEGAVDARVQLFFGWAAGGSVRFEDVEWSQPSQVTRRVVRAMVVNHRPRGLASREANVESFSKVVRAAAAQKPDIICLPEGISVVGLNRPYAEVAEPIPGPTTRSLGELARELNSWIVAGIYERAGSVIYNTAVLLDRQGKVAGRYRKTHLPREEVDAGLTPGNEYPVFDTDFGRVGLIVCWDLQFPEPARAMAARGAEVLLLPIWGGSEILARARAIENHAFLLSSSYDMRTLIIDPAGEILAEATAEKPAVTAELHLDGEIIQKWIGNMRARTWRERRADLPVEPGH